MKRVKNGLRVLTGNIVAGSYNGIENRIQLFDGRFTTGYRVIDFRIAPRYPLNAGEWVSKLTQSQSQPSGNGIGMMCRRSLGPNTTKRFSLQGRKCQ